MSIKLESVITALVVIAFLFALAIAAFFSYALYFLVTSNRVLYISPRVAVV